MPYVMTAKSAGDEISSTYEGRHIDCQESDLVHPTHTDNLVDKGDPVLMGANTVGVAFDSALLATNVIAVDTEGIWALTVLRQDELGASNIARGDQIFINKTTAVLSKIANKNTHQSFGYALSTLTAGDSGIVAVKVHWDPDDEIEQVGDAAAFYAMGATRPNGREYRYRSTKTSGDIRGMYMALALNGTGGGEAVRARTIIEAVGVTGGNHGLHGGIEFDTDGTITGLGVGVRATAMCPNRAAMATICGGMSELWAEGTSSNWNGATEHAIHRFVNDGNGTGKASAMNVFSFVGLSANQLQNHAAWVASLSKVLRVIVDGVVYYIGLSTAA